MKNHVDLSIRVPEQLCKDNKSIKDETSMYREKSKDPHSDGLDELPMSGNEIDDKELKKRLVHDNYQYAKTRKLGKEIS